MYYLVFRTLSEYTDPHLLIGVFTSHDDALTAINTYKMQVSIHGDSHEHQTNMKVNLDKDIYILSHSFDVFIDKTIPYGNVKGIQLCYLVYSTTNESGKIAEDYRFVTNNKEVAIMMTRKKNREEKLNAFPETWVYKEVCVDKIHYEHLHNDVYVA